MEHLHIPAHHERPFRPIMNAHSGSTWTAIPIEGEHFPGFSGIGVHDAGISVHVPGNGVHVQPESFL